MESRFDLLRARAHQIVFQNWKIDRYLECERRAEEAAESVPPFVFHIGRLRFPAGYQEALFLTLGSLVCGIFLSLTLARTDLWAFALAQALVLLGFAIPLALIVGRHFERSWRVYQAKRSLRDEDVEQSVSEDSPEFIESFAGVLSNYVRERRFQVTEEILRQKKRVDECLYSLDRVEQGLARNYDSAAEPIRTRVQMLFGEFKKHEASLEENLRQAQSAIEPFVFKLHSLCETHRATLDIRKIVQAGRQLDALSLESQDLRHEAEVIRAMLAELEVVALNASGQLDDLVRTALATGEAVREVHEGVLRAKVQ